MSSLPRVWRILPALCVFLLPGLAAAQSFSLDGFLKVSYIHDSRQVAAAREGDFLLFPTDESLAGGEDLNDTSNLLFMPFFSRLQLNIGDLPDALGGRVSGLFETDFYGANDLNTNSLRIRRAFAKLDWETHEALFGMEWSPAFLGTYPRTIGTETGAPYQPFSRYTQIRFTWKPKGWRLSAVAAQQRDAFSEAGGPKVQQQAAVPTLMAFAEWVGERHVIGVGGWSKWIRPALGADRFQASAAQAYVQFTPDPVELRAKVTWGEDLADNVMTGGYLARADTLDDGSPVPLKTLPLRTLAGWVDVQTRGDGLGLGAFGGYFSNLGAGEVAASDVLEVVGRGTSLEYGWRLAPRLTYNAGRMRFAFELSVDRALYASAFDNEYKPDPADADESVTNVRSNFTVFLFF